MGCGSSVSAQKYQVPVVIKKAEDKEEESRQSFESTITAGSTNSGPPPVTPAERILTSISCPSDAFKAAGAEDLCILGILGVSADESVIVEEEFQPKAIVSKPKNKEKLKSLLRRGTAVGCRHGRHSAPNQDTQLLCQVGHIAVWAIAAGRGENGHWASAWVAQTAMSLAFSEVVLPGMLPDDRTVRRIYNICNDVLQLRGDQNGVDLSVSGSTLSMCFLDWEARSVVAAQLGDSKILLVESDGEGREVVKVRTSTILTSQYDPRVFDSGASKASSRSEEAVSTVWMLGNFGMRMAGTDPSRPTTRRTQLAEGQCIICCSDGLWEHLSNEEATQVVAEAGPENAQEGVEELLQMARSRWDEGDDAADVSAIICWA